MTRQESRLVAFPAIAGGPVWRGNEPTGMTTIIDRPFDALDEPITPGGATSGLPSGTATIVADSTAPRGGNNSVVRATYTTGWVGGTAAYNYEWVHTGYRTVYQCAWIKYSANWWNHSAGTKQGYWWTNLGPPNGEVSVFFHMMGTGAGELTPEIDGQSLVQSGGLGTEPHFTPNIDPTVRVTRDKWVLIEHVLFGNTAGTADGTCDSWIDGVHSLRYTGLQWTALASFWDIQRLTFVWGGTGESVPATCWVDVDHLYCSGK